MVERFGSIHNGAYSLVDSDPGDPEYFTVIPDVGSRQPLATWRTYLFRLQQEAPKPKRVVCFKEILNSPDFYGNEFHGGISRETADRLVNECDGSYLVRKSDRAHDAFTLVIRSNNQTKNYKLFYDGQHFVGEKKFDTVHDLVADGLITFYIETNAADYIATLSTNESNYAESPYAVNSTNRRIIIKSQRRPVPPQRHVYQDQVDNSTRQIEESIEETPEEEETFDVSEFEKAHCFKVHNFIGFNWCDYCLNFMWGLVAQGVRCQDCGFQAHKKCSEKVPNDCMPEMRYVKKIFGADLTTVVKAQCGHIPIPVVVDKCVQEIELRGLKVEGIYRVAGFHDDVEEIKMSFDKEGDATDISSSKYDDINTISSLLKLYFRLLPIPLITFEVYPLLMDVVRNTNFKGKDLIDKFKDALALLPPAHMQTLKYLAAHLNRVIEYKKHNMMGTENVSMVFAPTLMRPEESNPMESLMAIKFEQQVVEILLEHYKELLK